MDKSLHFGDGLNSIIGSRGSGKSFLINLMCNSYTKYSSNDINDIVSQITIKEVVYKSGKRGKFLESGTFDFIPQKNSLNNKKEPQENTIYEILAEAPYDVSIFKKNIERKIPVLKNTTLNIDEVIDYINEAFDIWEKIIKSSSQEKKYQFFQTYNSFALSASSSLKIKNILSNLFNAINKSLSDKKESIILALDMSQVTDKLIENLKKIITINEYKIKATQYNFDNLIKELDDLSSRHIPSIKTDLEINVETLLKVNKIVTSFSQKINDELNNSELTYNIEFQNLKNEIHDMVVLLRESKTRVEKIRGKMNLEIKNEETLSFNINEIKYNIKTEKVLNLKDISNETIESMFVHYKSKIPTNIFELLFLNDYFGNEFIKHYNEIDKRSNNFNIDNPYLDEVVLISVADGDFKNLNEMSPGERANILMDMVLNDSSNKILIIDQPEDDLDNETIQKTIVDKIRKLKLRRQIILITHNANICINGDSDSIIICQNSKGKYSYISNAIETPEKYDYISINSEFKNKKFLDIVVEILEGGKEALRKRVKKIGYKDIFFKEESENESEI